MLPARTTQEINELTENSQNDANNQVVSPITPTAPGFIPDGVTFNVLPDKLDTIKKGKRWGYLPVEDINECNAHIGIRWEAHKKVIFTTCQVEHNIQKEYQ